MNRINISKDEYLNNLKDIRNYITCMEEQHSLIDNFDRENLDVNIIKQRFTKVMSTPVVYNAVIISLYGCFENYIDKIADFFDVSADYLLEKTDDKSPLPKEAINIFDNVDMNAFSRQLYEQLTKEERKKVQEYILFLISQRAKNEKNDK